MRKMLYRQGPTIALALAAVLLSAVLSIWQPLVDGVDWQYTHQFYKEFLRDAFWRGEAPFWNPYVYLGRPFLADVEAAAFYLPTWLGENVQRADNWVSAMKRFIAGDDPRQVTWLEAGTERPSKTYEGGAFAPARVEEFSLNRVLVRLPERLESPRVPVLAEAWYPGWRAVCDDGSSQEVFPVNVWMRGVEVPAGVQAVEFVYRPVSLLRGAMVSALAGCAWMLIGYRTRKNRPASVS